MERRFKWMGVFAAVLVAIVVGTIAYNAGVSHGLAIGAPAAGAAQDAARYWYRPWGFGFFPFGFLLVWLLFARLMFWGGGCRRRWYYPGPYDAPPSFDDWHRRAHERMNNQPRD